MQFMRYQPARDGGRRSWLLITAEREAWRLHRAEAGHVPLLTGRPSDDERGHWEPADLRDDRMKHAEAREALELLVQVPDRRRRALELHVSGFTYDEIAQTLGTSHTRVNHLLCGPVTGGVDAHTDTHKDLHFAAVVDVTGAFASFPRSS